LVVAVYTIPRSTDVAVTVAPGTDAPLGSVTVPVMEAVTSWLHAVCNVTDVMTNMVSNKNGRQLNALSARFITQPSSNYSNVRLMLYSGWLRIVKKKMKENKGNLI
jgi:hypothetical protein